MLNENIKKLRLARGISQVELAVKLHVSKQCVSNWENDNIQPSVEMLIKLARFFEVSTDYLLGMDMRESLYIDGLTEREIAHLKLIIDDLKNKSRNHTEV